MFARDLNKYLSRLQGYSRLRLQETIISIQTYYNDNRITHTGCLRTPTGYARIRIKLLQRSGVDSGIDRPLYLTSPRVRGGVTGTCLPIILVITKTTVLITVNVG